LVNPPYRALTGRWEYILLLYRYLHFCTHSKQLHHNILFGKFNLDVNKPLVTKALRDKKWEELAIAISSIGPPRKAEDVSNKAQKERSQAKAQARAIDKEQECN
jgi:hypothetical protein